MPQVCAGTEWIALGVLNPAAGGGSCTNPARTEGTIAYNVDFNVLQYCDGTSWIALHGGPGGGSGGSGCTGPSDCSSIGDQCTDTTIFAGCHPTLNGDWLFLHPNNQSTGNPWSTESVATSATDPENGKINQDWIVANKATTTYLAFKFCDDLSLVSALGHADWYVPSRVEMYYLWSVQTAINAGPGDAFVATEYWSSTQFNNGNAWTQKFSDGDNDFIGKGLSRDVRCLRRPVSGSCNTTPTTYTTPGSFAYTVPANCTSATLEAYGAGGGGADDGGSTKGGGGGGGGSIVFRSATLLVAGGGGGGAGNITIGGGGGGGGYALSTVAVTPGENLTVYVGGGAKVHCTRGGDGGNVSGTAGVSGSTNAATSLYGGGGGAVDGNAGGSTYGGGGGINGNGAGDTAGSSTYGGGGGAGTGIAGTSATGGNGSLGATYPAGGGGGGFGDTVIIGGNGLSDGFGGPAANGGPGVGGQRTTCGWWSGDGQVVITPGP